MCSDKRGQRNLNNICCIQYGPARQRTTTTTTTAIETPNKSATIGPLKDNNSNRETVDYIMIASDKLNDEVQSTDAEIKVEVVKEVHDENW